MGSDIPEGLIPLHPRGFEILLALGESPAHGYALIRRIRDQTRGGMVLSTSSLYAALARMSDRGLVVEATEAEPGSSGGPPRRCFRITRLGRRVAHLEAERLRRAISLAEERLGAAEEA